MAEKIFGHVWISFSIRFFPIGKWSYEYSYSYDQIDAFIKVYLKILIHYLILKFEAGETTMVDAPVNIISTLIDTIDDY